MLSLTDLRKGTFVQLDGAPYQVIDYRHTQLGRGGAIVRVKLKNLVTGSLVSKTFKGNDKIEPARLEKVDMQYLYRVGNQAHLMDLKSYEQTSLVSSDDQQIKWLVEGAEVVALTINQRIVGLDLPAKLTLKVAKADAAVRGDTTGTATKSAVLESGAELQVPLFIKPGDKIQVDTRTGSYDGRV